MPNKKQDPNALEGVNWNKYVDKNYKKKFRQNREVTTRANFNVSRQLFHRNSDSSITPPMIAAPNELLRSVDMVDINLGLSRKKLTKMKLQEADAPARPEDEGYDMPGHFGGLTDSIRQNGYNWDHPIVVNPHTLELLDGHHRAMVMGRDRPHELMPIEYMGETVSHSRLQSERQDYLRIAKKHGYRKANEVYPLDNNPHLKDIYDTE